MFEILNEDRPEVTLNGTKFQKEIIKFGKFRHPNPLFRDKKFDLDFDEELGEVLIKNFDDGIVESVKYLGTHDEEEAKKLGVITALKMTDTGIDAIIEVEDEDAIKEIRTMAGDGKSLAHGVSSGIDNSFPLADAKGDETVKGPVLRHVAQATIPWIQGMSDWETVEDTIAASNSVLFGHENYTGVPLVHAKDDEKDGEGMNPILRKALEVLAANKGKTIEEIAKDLGVELEEEENEPSDADKILAGLTKLSKSLEEKNDEDDDDDDDDDDDKKKSAAVRAAEKILATQNGQVKQVTASVVALTTAFGEAQKEIAAQKEISLQASAEGAVLELINAGKVLPKDKAHYVSLYRSNEDTFKGITESLPVQVVSFDEGVPADPWGSSPMAGKMNKEEEDKETDRYVKMITPQSAGNGDNPKNDGRVDN